MQAKLHSAALFKQILDAMKDLVAETNFDCSSSGIAIQAMDSAHVCLVSLLLRPEGFESFRCHRPVSLGANLASMAKAMKCANNDDSIELSCAEGSDVLRFTFRSVTGDQVTTFELKLMDISGESLGIPDQNADAKVTMESREFQRRCRDLSTIGDTVTISVHKDRVSLAVSGDSGKVEVSIKNVSAQKEAVKIELKQEVTASFALKYLNFFAKATSLSENVQFQIGADIPLMVEYAIKDLGYIRYYLAPKNEEAMV